MTRYRKALGILFVSLLGLWGCARIPSTEASSSNADKIKALETKTAKLEADLKGVLAGRESLRKQLDAAEEAQMQMQREIERLQPVVKERDELLVLVKAKTIEREQLQNQYDGFRRNLKELLGQAEAAMPPAKPNNAGLASRPVNLPAATGAGGGS